MWTSTLFPGATTSTAWMRRSSRRGTASRTSRLTPCSLYTLLHLCMSLFCLLRVLRFALGRVLTGSKLHQHAHPTEVRLLSLDGQLVIRARSCQMAFLIGFGPRGFRSCFSLNGSASQISRTIGETGGSESRGLPVPIPKSPRDPMQMTRGLRF